MIRKNNKSSNKKNSNNNNNNNNNNNIKIVFHKISFLSLMIICAILFSGCSLKALKSDWDDFTIKAKITYESFFGDPCYRDSDLEEASLKQSSEKGSALPLAALDACKSAKAKSFVKKYFNESGNCYLYYSKGQNIYLAVMGVTTLSKSDYYEIIMYKEKESEEEKDTFIRSILARYYVNAKTLDVYDEDEKPEETKLILDNGLGFKLYLPKKYENNIKAIYLDPEEIKVGNNMTEVRVLVFNYIEGATLNEVFNLIVFKGKFDKNAFAVDSKDSTVYYLGYNDNYTFCINKSKVNDNYFDNAKDLINKDFEYILNNIEIY